MEKRIVTNCTEEQKRMCTIYHRFSLIVLLFTGIIWCETKVGGTITHDTRWNVENGPFYITSDLYVPRHIRLTITPGTRVIVGGYPGLDTTVKQYDAIDKKSLAIKVKGTLICVGRSKKRITFLPDSTSTGDPAWYGIILDNVDEQFTEIANADITGAYCGITVRDCAPVISNCIIDYNHIGLFLADNGSAQIYNCVIAYNSAAGIRITDANPTIMNNIIAFNRNNGIWCDGHSKISCTYNCIADNNDGNFLTCDPELGLKVKKMKNGDSVDVFKNITTNPIFSGSVAESAATQQDITKPTPKDKIRNNAIAAVIYDKTKKPEKKKNEKAPTGRYVLSPYSPCIDAGNPSGMFKDKDGSRNDMGIWGGPEFGNK